MRALSLSGGGFQGLFTALLLEKIEQERGSLLRDQFEVFGGTSVGGLIAAAAAVGMPMPDLVRVFRDEGVKIFSGRPAPSSNAAIMRDFMRYVSHAKYDGAHLSRVVKAYCGDRRMGDLDRALVIPAVRLMDGAPVIFTRETHPDLPLHDVVLATTAAPMIFPPVRVSGSLHADGAVFANCPDAIVLDHVKNFMGVPRGEITMLGVGAMNQAPPLSEPPSPNMGAVAWMAANRIFRTVISSQSMMVANLVSNELGNSYHRIDADPEGYNRRLVGLDVADAAAISAINEAANETWDLERSRFEIFTVTRPV